MRKLIASMIVAAGATAAMVAAAPLAAAGEPFEGHYDGCTGEYDGGYCWTDMGFIEHLDLL
jgi:hypothetical protein